jgi:hypothetical protein
VTEVKSNNTGPMQPAPRRSPFRKRRSATKADQPLHKIATQAQQVMVDDIAAIIKVVTEAAKAGDIAAAKFVLDRVLPARKGRFVSFPLPPMRSAAEVLEGSNAVLVACASGLITLQEAADISGIIAEYAKLIEKTDLEKRIECMEQELERALERA